MGNPKNRVTFVAFTAAAFQDAVRVLSGAPATADANPQTQRLSEHIQAHAAPASEVGDARTGLTMVIEDHYVDRHFIEEVGIYYARCLRPPPNYCGRIHVFRGRLTEAEFDAEIRCAIAGNRDDVQDRLSDRYIGFVVVRPIPAVPIGRTVLLPPRGDTQTEIRSPVRQTVHLCGIPLIVREGVAFQQQDRAVAACATTAAWSVLHPVCRREGKRPPTPADITQAAVRHYIPEGRAYPSQGLRVEQICEALRAFDFPPDILNARDPEMFRVLLGVYLRSGIPTILALHGENSGHAVAAIGYRRNGSPKPRSAVDSMPACRFLNGGFDTIYAHDDRIGPYVEFDLATTDLKECPGWMQPEARQEGVSSFLLATPRSGVRGPFWVRQAIVPLYPKLRSSATDLFYATADTVFLASRSGEGESADVECFFSQSGAYLEDLCSAHPDPDHYPQLAKELALSRYVGVVRWKRSGVTMFDALYDTTDARRQIGDRPDSGAVLGFVLFDRHSASADLIRSVAKDVYKVPCN